MINTKIVCDYIYKILFWIGICATTINLGLYNDLAKEIAVIVFIFLFFVALLRSRLRNIPSIFGLWAFALLLGIISCLFRSGNIEYMYNIIIPILICFTSTYLFSFNGKDLYRFFIPFTVLYCYCAYQCVVRGVGMFSMASNYIDSVAKNQICPYFAIVSIVTLGLALYDSKFISKLYFLLVTIIGIIPSLYLLNRTSLIAFALASIGIVFTKFRFKGLLLYTLLLFLLFLIFGGDIVSLLYESVVGHRDATNLDSLTSGRASLNMIALEFIENHFFLGEIATTDRLNVDPHMFILWITSRFGIIGSAPFYILYTSIIWILVKAYKQKDLLCLGVLIIALVESLAEYASPFGPGSTYVFCYSIVGVFINKYFLKNKQYRIVA